MRSPQVVFVQWEGTKNAAHQREKGELGGNAKIWEQSGTYLGPELFGQGKQDNKNSGNDIIEGLF